MTRTHLKKIIYADLFFEELINGSYPLLSFMARRHKYEVYDLIDELLFRVYDEDGSHILPDILGNIPRPFLLLPRPVLFSTGIITRYRERKEGIKINLKDKIDCIGKMPVNRLVDHVQYFQLSDEGVKFNAVVNIGRAEMEYLRQIGQFGQCTFTTEYINYIKGNDLIPPPPKRACIEVIITSYYREYLKAKQGKTFPGLMPRLREFFRLQ